jgi:hypothetical protein
VENAKYDNGIRSEHKENAIGETAGKRPAQFGTTTQPPMFARIFGSTLDCGVNFGNEFFP